MADEDPYRMTKSSKNPFLGNQIKDNTGVKR